MFPPSVPDEAGQQEWVQRSVARAVASTPSLIDLTRRHIGDQGPRVLQVFNFVPQSLSVDTASRLSRLADLRASYDVQTLIDESSAISPADARRAILAIYVRQALADADSGNLHRGHVILSDVLRMMSLEQETVSGSGGGVRSLFGQVVNQANLDTFSAALSRYVEDQADALVISGENASILHAAGLRDGAEFIRAALLAKYELLVIPLIGRAQSRADNAGYRPPETLRRFQKLILKHIESLRGNGKLSVRHKEEASAAADADYDAALKRFRNLWTGESASSLDKTLADLRALKRPIAAWYDEKLIASVNCPLQFLPEGISREHLATGIPLEYDKEEQRFKDANLLEFVAERRELGDAIRTWCRETDSGPLLRAADGHFVLGWYWLEVGQPALARQAWIDGARELLGASAAMNDRGGKIAVEALLDELNAYRLLAAASFITFAPPGVIVDRTNAYETEIRAITADWVSTWTLNGHSQKEAQRVVEQMFRADITKPGQGSSRQAERYPFFEYRFRSGSVPDVLVDVATASELFDSDGLFYIDESAAPQRRYDRIRMFLRGFQLPTEFSDGAARRWTKN